MKPEDPLSILVAHASDDRRSELRSQLEELGHEVVAEVEKAAELIGEALRSVPQLIVTAVDFPDGNGIDSLLKIAERSPLPSIVVTTRDHLSAVEKAMDDHVLAYLIEPVETVDLKPSILLVMEKFRQFEELKDQVASLEDALESRKIIERAKGVLMHSKDLSENDAYRALQKLANDERKKLVEVAKAVLIAQKI